jgi:hypothetical protein
MPSAINIDGKVTRRPGVYGKADASALAGSALDVNRVALLGEFPLVEHAVPLRLNSPQAFKDLDTNDIDGLAIYAKYLWNPANDPKVPGGPNAVWLVNIQPNTQAQHTFKDSTPVDSLVLKSQMWGPRGNKTLVKISINAEDATLLDFLIGREGVAETYERLGSGDLVSFWYDGTEMDTVTLAFGSGTMTIEQSKAGIAIGSYVPSEAAFDGTLTIDPSQAPSSSQTYTATVSGINKATGLSDTDVLTWDDTDTEPNPKTTVKAFSDVFSILFAESGSDTPTFTLTNDAFSLDAATYPKASQLAERVNEFNSAEYYASIDAPKAYSTPTSELDAFTAATIVTEAAKKALRADLYQIVQALNASQLITAERATGAVGPPAPVSFQYLSGGTKTTTDATSRQTALDALIEEDVQILVTDQTDATFHDEIRTHCANIVANGGGERNAWVPAASLETKAQIFTRTAALNTRHMALVAQDVEITDTVGTVGWYGPHMLALIMAGIQSATNVATPLTRKIPNVIDVRQNTGWKPNQDAEELLENGLCFLTRWRLGWRVERSITTYQIDDNPIYSEVSANESMDTSIRDLREQLDAFIGDPNVETTRARVESVAKARLRQQVELGVIKAFNEPGLNVEDLGDRYRINYELAAVEPLNFIEVSATVTRTPFGQ